MPPIAETPPGVIGYLVSAIVVMGGTIGVLFWQLIAAKNETTAAYKEMLPVATKLLDTVTELRKLIDRFETKT